MIDRPSATTLWTIQTTVGGKLIMFLAIDRVPKFTHVEFHDCAGKIEGAAFLRNVVEVFSYKIHTVLTDNGMAFADLPKNRTGPRQPIATGAGRQADQPPNWRIFARWTASSPAGKWRWALVSVAAAQMAPATSVSRVVIFGLPNSAKIGAAKGW